MSQNPFAQDQELWQEDQRIVLHLLHSYFAFDSTTLTNIFNHVFDDHLQACGISVGLKPRDIASQYRQRNHRWPELLKKPTTKTGKRRRQQFLRRIRNAAAAVDSSTEWNDNAAGNSDDGEGTLPRGYIIPTRADAEILLARQNDNMFGFQDLRHIEKDSRACSKKLQRVIEPTSPADVIKLSFNGNKRKRDPEHEHDKSIRKASRGDQVVARESDAIQSSSPGHAHAVREQLEMLHWSDVNWEKGIQPWKEVTTIDRDSQTYQRGGQVHRITLADGIEVDVMLCDPAFCKSCHSNANPPLESEIPISQITTVGLPFVHSSEIIRDEGVLIFKPGPKAHSRDVGEEGFRRLVSFWTLGGQLTCLARICGYGDCEICCADHMELELKCTAKKVIYRK